MDIYNRLQQRLDLHPAGAPAHESFDKILRILFSPEEAEIACKMNFIMQPLSKLAEKTGLDKTYLQDRLESMANRGILMAKAGKDGEYRYSLVPTIPGLYEFPFMRPERNPNKDELAKLWQVYHTAAMGNAFAGSATPQMRVIPVQKTIPIVSEVLPYELVSEMIVKATYIAVTNCACRVSVQACDKPLEVCLAFDTGAQFLTERDLARYIDAREAMDILDKCEEAGLVHCVNNSQDKFGIVCNCCSCCCSILRGITELENPNAVATSSYIINYTEDECTGCFLCMEDRCPVKAISENGELVKVDQSRCIGCGLCVSVCPVEALSLEKREIPLPTPATMQDMFFKILKEKGRVEEFIQLNKE